MGLDRGQSCRLIKIFFGKNQSSFTKEKESQVVSSTNLDFRAPNSELITLCMMSPNPYPVHDVY
jgi:hypothetical protein